MNNSVEILNKIVSNIEKVIVGKKKAIELILISLICDGHVLIEDVPGVGKTSIVSSLAKSVNASFKEYSLHRIFFLQTLQDLRCTIRKKVNSNIIPEAL